MEGRQAARTGPRLRLEAVLAVIAVLAGAMVATVAARPRPQPLQHRLSAADDRPPADAAYEQALKRGLSGDLAGARQDMLQLAHSRRGTSTGAWALYQAAIAAQSARDRAAAQALTLRLQQEYPLHPLTLRLAPGEKAEGRRQKAVEPRQWKADCGPRSLLLLCHEAGVPAELPELTRRCGTDEHGTTLQGLAQAAKAKGLRVTAAQVDAAYLQRHRPAGIAWIDGDHFAAFLPGAIPDRVWLHDPNAAARESVAVDELVRRSQGIVLLTAWGDRKLPPVP